MTLNDLKIIIAGCVNDVLFEFNKKQCGITSVVNDYIPTFTVWYGKDYIDTNDVDKVMNYKLFDGKSLSDIYSNVELTIS